MASWERLIEGLPCLDGMWLGRQGGSFAWEEAEVCRRPTFFMMGNGPSYLRMSPFFILRNTFNWWFLHHDSVAYFLLDGSPLSVRPLLHSLGGPLQTCLGKVSGLLPIIS